MRPKATSTALKRRLASHDWAMTTDYTWRCAYRGCAVRFRHGPDRLCPMHTADSSDTMLARMVAFDSLSAIPGEREADGSDQAAQ